MNHFDRTSDLLGAARHEMATRGQYKKGDFGPDGTVCLRGALAAALGYNETPQWMDEAWEAIGPAWQALHNAMGARGILGSVISFNFHHDLNDCLDLYHEAQILAKEAGD
jgi:hypothetical protein